MLNVSAPPLDVGVAPRKIRCGVYTRKSTEEGLDQDFNSLHAQREACEAYIASQKHEGWVLLPAAYDDGGVSGGHMDRPGVQQLLADVDAGLVDQIVVYKVDRLTRNLMDFSKLVDQLDTAGASFVSVTQSFNTATSMGRLTLNMLLSFAQFEREVTAERIRDKVASSKAKGMWMGGTIPFGYRNEGRTLVIREDEAAQVRHLFQAYTDGMTIVELAQHCLDERILSRKVTLKTGKITGGIPYTRGPLNYMLKNPLYIGKIRHKGQVYEGLHPAIVDEDLWDRVQRKMADNTQGKSAQGAASKAKLPLLGLLFVKGINVQPGQMKVTFNQIVPGDPSIIAAFTHRRCKNEQRLIIEGKGYCDATLLKNLALAKSLYEKTKQGFPITDAAEQLGIAADKLRRLTSLMFLAPSILEKAANGTLSAAASYKWFERTKLPSEFDAQLQKIATLV